MVGRKYASQLATFLSVCPPACLSHVVKSRLELLEDRNDTLPRRASPYFETQHIYLRTSDRRCSNPNPLHISPSEVASGPRAVIACRAYTLLLPSDEKKKRNLVEEWEKSPRHNGALPKSVIWRRRGGTQVGFHCISTYRLHTYRLPIAYFPPLLLSYWAAPRGHGQAGQDYCI